MLMKATINLRDLISFSLEIAIIQNWSCNLKMELFYNQFVEDKRDFTLRVTWCFPMECSRFIVISSQFYNLTSDPGGILTRALQNRNLTFYTAKLRGLAITVD